MDLSDPLERRVCRVSLAPRDPLECPDPADDSETGDPQDLRAKLASPDPLDPSERSDPSEPADPLDSTASPETPGRPVSTDLLEFKVGTSFPIWILLTEVNKRVFRAYFFPEMEA